MEKIKTLTFKEFLTYFKLPIAYIFIVIFLTTLNWFFFQDFFLRGQINIKPYFDLFPLMFLIFIPALSMRLFSEEKSQKTEEVLLTLPISDWQVVLGKFLGSLLFLIFSLSLSFPVCLTLFSLGKFDYGILISGYLGTIFLGGFYLSLGMFISSFSKGQIVSYIVSLVFLFFFFILGSEFVLLSSPKFLRPIFQFLGVTFHFSNFTRGIIDSRDIIYFLTFITFFLILSKKRLESRLWQ